jgi:anaerobic dimethyl sulfoxide reductase subunit C (anchor subunit)
MPSLITSLVFLAVGGIAVTFHLAQPLHIFNGFGNPTSGITQELVVMVIFVVVMLLMFINLRRSGEVPKWCAVCAILVSVILDIICSHSYMMASKPAWDSILQIVGVLGCSCLTGPAVVAVIGAIKKVELPSIGNIVLIGTIVGFATTVIYLIALCFTGTGVTTIGTYIDPTNPTQKILEPSTLSPFSGEALPLSILTIVLAAAAVVCGFMGRKTSNWKLYGTIAAICAIVAIILLRVVFYMLGISVYDYYGMTGNIS